MKKLTVITAALVAGATLANAEELSISTTFAYESEYVFRGFSLGEDTFMPGLDISYGSFYAGVWSALPIDDKFDVEVDFYAGYGFDVSETIGLDFGVTYYTYPNDNSGIDDTVEAYFGVNFALPVSPSVYVFYDFDLEALVLEGAIGHSFAMGDSSSIDLSANYGHIEPDQGDSVFYYGAGVSYNYAFTDSASISIYSNFYGAEEDTIGNDDNVISYGFSFTAGF